MRFFVAFSLCALVVIPGCKEKVLGPHPGAPCSPQDFCDQDKGLFCDDEQGVCACDGMYKWDEATKICAETETARTLREGEVKCQKGEHESCFVLGRLFLLGAHVARDDATAVKYFKKACDGGLEKACAAMVVKRAEEVCSVSLPCDKTQGLVCDNATSRCRCDSSAAWNESKGKCLETEVAKHLRVSRERCSDGDMEGCHMLGQMYTAGKGVSKDDDKARTLFTQACKAGFKTSCNFCVLLGGCADATKKR